MIKAEILADSVNWTGKRLTTFKLTFPRIILSEFNTHRAFSRNSASSRAIPFEKMVESVEKNPFIPIAWQKDHKGMQGTEYIRDSYYPEKIWLEARDFAIQKATELNSGILPNNMDFKGKSDYNFKVTKQLCNRLLEPFMYHTVIMTCEEEGLENFFSLRCPQYQHPEKFMSNPPRLVNSTLYRSKKDYLEGTKVLTFDDKYFQSINKGQAEIHIMALAEAMWDVFNSSTPEFLLMGEYHIPFEKEIKSEAMWNAIEDATLSGLRKLPLKPSTIECQISVAKCARISYTVVGEENSTDYLKDLKLFDKLLESRHLSPFEHIAKVPDPSELNYLSEGWYFDTDEGKEIFIPGQLCSNFNGWIQYRKLVENEELTSSK